ncbi:MAG: ABC transporter permease [Anaerolineae bacterium]
MRHALDIYRRLIAVRIRSQLQYRISALLDVVAMAIVTGVEFGALAFVFQRFDTIAGWTLGEVAFLYGIATATFGTMDLVFGGFDPDTFGPMVQRGALDQLLLKPVNITLQVLGSAFLLRRFGKIAQGIVIFCIALSMTAVDWTLAKIIYLPVVFVSQVAFFGGLFIIGATSTFWTVQRVEAINIFTYGGSELMSYPMHIYAKWMRRFFTYIVPMVFLNYYPALYFLDKPDPLHGPAFAPFLAPVAGFGMLAAALGLWRFGLKHYTSTGT